VGEREKGVLNSGESCLCVKLRLAPKEENELWGKKENRRLRARINREERGDILKWQLDGGC